MKHPWGKMFDRALRQSTLEDNLVFVKAEELREKGYRAEEIAEVLERLRKSLIEEQEEQILAEALEEFKELYIEPSDEEV